MKTHSLVVGFDNGNTLEKFPLSSDYRVEPWSSPAPIFTGASPIAGCFCPVASLGSHLLYVLFSGQIIEYDLLTGFRRTIVSMSGGRNILPDAQGTGKRLIFFSHYNDIVAIDPVSLVRTILVSGNLVGNAIAMQWAPNGDLCVLSSYGGYAFPNEQAILRFDGHTFAQQPDLVSRATSITVNNLRAASHFAFGPEGEVYVAKILEGNIVRLNGTTGQAIDVFIEAKTLKITPSNLLFSPDGKTLFVRGNGSGLLEFDLAGNLLRTIDLWQLKSASGYATFITEDGPEKVPDKSRYPVVILLFLLRFWFKDELLLEDRGQLAAKIWTELSPEDKEVLLALGIHELSRRLKNDRTAAEIQKSVRQSLGENLFHRLDALIALHG